MHLSKISTFVLLFPPVNNYRRFLIHKACEGIATEYDIVTFSIGQRSTRRTVVCYRKQLIIPLEELSGDKKRKEEKQKSWRSECFIESAKNMGIEKKPDVSTKLTRQVDLYRPPALRKLQPLAKPDIKGNNSSNDQIFESAKPQPQIIENGVTVSNVQSNVNQTDRPPRRERRPDRAVYIPRARRSQTTPPQFGSASSISHEIIHSSTDLGQREINESELPICSFNKESEVTKESMSVISNRDNKRVEEQQNSFEQDNNYNSTTTTPNFTLANDCDSVIQEDSNDSINSTNLKNQNYRNMNHTKINSVINEIQDKLSDSNIIPRIENAGLAKESREDKEIEELERVSKEINRSSRRIIKQTFKSDVLEIPDSVLLQNEDEPSSVQKSKDIDPLNDDWDTMFDDNGECVDPKIISELTASVGKVKIELPKADYKAYHLKQSILNEEEFPHVLEVSNFPVEFKTQDLMMAFSAYKESGFDIKWVDDTHALAVFSSSRIAAEVLAMGHPFVLLKPLADATVESRTKAKKCASSLQPYRPRPETCAALARRLVTGALGVRLKTATEERENEKRVLREAKERKLLAAKQRDEVWES